MAHNSQHGPSPTPLDNADAIGSGADWVRVDLDGKLAKAVGGVGLATELYDPVEGFKEDGNQFGDNFGQELAGASASVGGSAVAGVYGDP